jgi:hypothetical protein
MQMLSSTLAAADPLLEHPVRFTLAAKTQQWIRRSYVTGLNFRGSKIMREISNHTQCAMFNGFNIYISLHALHTRWQAQAGSSPAHVSSPVLPEVAAARIRWKMREVSALKQPKKYKGHTGFSLN